MSDFIQSLRQRAADITAYDNFDGSGFHDPGPKRPADHETAIVISAAADLLDKATKFLVRKACSWSDDVYVEVREQADGSRLWAVTRAGAVRNRDGEWEYEGFNSNRTDEFIARTRFSFDEAMRMAAAVPEEELWPYGRPGTKENNA